MYKYSIIIPVYNAENSIDRSIESVLAQTYSNWELILVNDGSTDGSAEVINRYTDERIRVINQDNAGPGRARNTGIQNITGDYVAFMDSDDYYENDYLESIDKINKESKKDVVFIDFINELEDGTVKESSQIIMYKDESKDSLIKKQMTGKLPWGPVVKAVDAEIIKECQFGKMDVGEEAVYSFDVLNRSNNIGFVSKPKYHYIYNENGQHKKGGLDPWRPAVESIANHLKELGLFEKYKSTVNSFAVKALCINVYRCAGNFKRKEAVRKIGEAYRNYKSEYNFKDLDKTSLDKKSILILKALKFHQYHLVLFASWLRR